MYRKILSNGLIGYAKNIATDCYDEAFFDLKSLYDWLWLQFNGIAKLEKCKDLWLNFQQLSGEHVDQAYYRYIQLKRDYESAVKFATDRGENPALNAKPTETEMFKKFINGLYKTTQQQLLQVLTNRQLEWKFDNINTVLKDVKLLTTSSFGINLKYSHIPNQTVNHINHRGRNNSRRGRNYRGRNNRNYHNRNYQNRNHGDNNNGYVNNGYNQTNGYRQNNGHRNNRINRNRGRNNYRGRNYRNRSNNYHHNNNNFNQSGGKVKVNSRNS